MLDLLKEEVCSALLGFGVEPIWIVHVSGAFAAVPRPVSTYLLEVVGVSCNLCTLSPQGCAMMQ